MAMEMTSNQASSQVSAGTASPRWPRVTQSPIALSKVDLPDMFGPVIRVTVSVTLMSLSTGLWISGW